MRLRTGHSLATDPQLAVVSLHRAIARADGAVALFFRSSRFDLDALDRADGNDHEP